MGNRTKEILLIVLAATTLVLAIFTLRPKAASTPELPPAPPEPVMEEQASEEVTEESNDSASAAPSAPEGEAKGRRNPFAIPSIPAGVETAPAEPEPAEAGESQPFAGSSPQSPADEKSEQENIALAGITSGKSRMAIIREGDTRYFVSTGDVVGDGYKVTAIRDNEVVLLRDSEKVTLKMGGRQ